MWAAQTPLLLLIFAAVLTLFAKDAITAIIPWMILLGVISYASFRVRRTRALQGRVQRVSEWTQLGQHSRAARAIWPLLLETQMMPEVHGKLVAMLAHNLDKLCAWDSAEVAYDYLIDRMPTDHLGSVQLQLQRTVLQLFNDELSTADQNLRKLRPQAITLSNTPICALFTYASLLQQVQTYHFADAVAENKSNLVQQLRILGIDAGHGYALLAWSYFQLAQRKKDDSSLMDQALAWWRKANLLLSSSKLLARQPELKSLAAHAAYEAPPGSNAASDTDNAPANAMQDDFPNNLKLDILLNGEDQV